MHTSIRAGHTCTHTNISTYMGPKGGSGQPSRHHLKVYQQFSLECAWRWLTLQMVGQGPTRPATCIYKHILFPICRYGFMHAYIVCVWCVCVCVCVKFMLFKFRSLCGSTCHQEQGWAILEITGDDYHVLKYHDIRYYHDNVFWLVFCILFVANWGNFYKSKHLNQLCAFLSIKFQVMYA